MDYNNVKLGLIGRMKVWNQRRIAEAQRGQYYKDEGELLEVDYTEADKLEAYLLEQKKIKKATRDAKKLYKTVYGKNSDGVGEYDFIEEYLVEQGLKQKALPETNMVKPEPTEMEQHLASAVEENPTYEKPEVEPKIYYAIGETQYEMPASFMQYISTHDELADNVTQVEEGKYVISDDGMKMSAKQEMLTHLIDSSLKELAFDIEFNEPDEDVREDFMKLSRMSSAKKWLSDKLVLEGKETEAIDGLKKKLGEILKFRDDRAKNEQDDLEI